MTSRLISFIDDESGATAIEYGLIATLVSIVIIVILTSMGTTLKGTFTSVNTGLSAN